VKHVRAALIGVVLATAWGAAVSAAPPTEPTTVPPVDPATASTTVATGPDGQPLPELQTPPPIANPIVASSPLVVVPTGCFAPAPPVAVFVGTLAASDATTGRFAVQQIRAGSLDGYAVDTIVDVRYDDDIRFLHTGEQYLVGAIPDAVTGVLRSKVRTPAPLFGGDAVIGLNDTDVTCPKVEDGVRTLLANGRDVDTGVLAPLKTAKKSVAKAFLEPMAIAFGILVLLASIKLLMFAMVRAARERPEVAPRPVLVEVPRDRRHAVEEVVTVDEPDPEPASS
jgi:hypothetical protein